MNIGIEGEGVKGACRVVKQEGQPFIMSGTSFFFLFFFF